jgi:hypothetical protein
VAVAAAAMGSCLLARSSRDRSVSFISREFLWFSGRGTVRAHLSADQQLNQLILRLVCELPLFRVACWLAFDHDAELVFNLLCWRSSVSACRT